MFMIDLDHGSLRPHGEDFTAGNMLNRRMDGQACGRMAELDKQIFNGVTSTSAIRLELLAMDTQQRAQYAQRCKEPLPLTAVSIRQSLETHWRHQESHGAIDAAWEFAILKIPILRNVQNVARDKAVYPLIMTRYTRTVSDSRICSVPDLTETGGQLHLDLYIRLDDGLVLRLTKRKGPCFQDHLALSDKIKHNR